MGYGTVTVLIPTYKRPEKLKRAIESVLSQTYSDLKVMVCDNASNDGTSEVVAGFMSCDDRVYYHLQTTNIGMNSNFNFAVSLVETPFFCFLTDDDYQLPNFIADSMAGFSSYPSAQFSVMEAPVINEGAPENVLMRVLSSWSKEGLYQQEEAIPFTAAGNHPVLTACIFRQELAPEVFFDERVGVISDVPILISLVTKYSFVLSRKVGLYFIRHSGAIGSSSAWQYYARLEQVLSERVSANVLARVMLILRPRINRIVFQGLLGAIRREDRAGVELAETVFVGQKLSLLKIMVLTLSALSKNDGINVMLVHLSSVVRKVRAMWMGDASK